MTTALPDASLLSQNHSAELGAAAEAINQLLRNHTLHKQLAEGVFGDDPRSQGVVFDNTGSIAFLYYSIDQVILQVDYTANRALLYNLVSVYGPLYHTIGISDRHVIFVIS